MAAALLKTEDGLLRAVDADEPLMTDLSRHLIKAGGKRIRPRLTIASAQALTDDPKTPSDDIISGGIAVELVHQGSLYHDDVMDGAETRRNVESVNSRWGNREAILAGDYLLARASEIAADLGTEVAGLLASTIATLCEGQLREVQSAFDPSRTEDAYLASISGKTAALLTASARIGAIVAGHQPEAVNALGAFGHHYGMAFQVVDDLLDVMATDEELGKPAGNDLVEGVYTLPVIRTLAGPAGANLRALLGGPMDLDSRNKARDLVRADLAIGSTVGTALDFTNQAREALTPLPSTPAVCTLQATCELLANRMSSFR
jgi:heptaprenyl diphosphate synthase